jgi:hypothetical protein
MKEYIKETLIAPGYVILVLLVQGKHFVNEFEFPHASQIHEHDTRVETELAVVRMTCEPIVPSHICILVLGRQRCQMRLVEVLKVLPHVLQVSKE